MNIKDAAAATGLPAKTIRYYEEIGLVTPLRAANGYRAFRPRDVDRLEFLARARALGFSIDDCRALIALREDPHRASADVKQLVGEHISALQHKINRLQSMADTLQGWYDCCKGNQEPDCAIIEQLSENKGTP